MKKDDKRLSDKSTNHVITKFLNVRKQMII